MSGTSRVFITHSSLDQPLAEALVEALRLGANLPEERIFCSSVEGLGIPTGAEFLHYIREQLQDTDLVVPLITPGYLDSMFCASELGAAWVRDVAMFPLAVPPVPRGGLPGPLGAKQVAAFGKGGLNECLKVVIARTAGAKQSSRWEKHRDQLLSTFDELQPELATAWATTLLALQRRAARHAAAAPQVHEVFHLIRDAAFLRIVAGDRADLRSLLAHLHRIAVATEAVFSRTTDTPCRVTIKQLQLEDDVLRRLTALECVHEALESSRPGRPTPPAAGRAGGVGLAPPDRGPPHGRADQERMPGSSRARPLHRHDRAGSAH